MIISGNLLDFFTVKKEKLRDAFRNGVIYVVLPHFFVLDSDSPTILYYSQFLDQVFGQWFFTSIGTPTAFHKNGFSIVGFKFQFKAHKSIAFCQFLMVDGFVDDISSFTIKAYIDCLHDGCLACAIHAAHKINALSCLAFFVSL